MKKLKEYNLQFQIDVLTSITIKAESLEDAVERSKELGVTDIIDITGDHLDSSLKLTGVYE